VQADRVGHTRPFAPRLDGQVALALGEASCLAQVVYPLRHHPNKCSGNAGFRPSTQLSSQGLPSNRSGLIRLAGQLDLAASRAEISFDPHVLHEFGIAGSADPANSLSGGPSFSGLRPGSILLPRAHVAGFSVWWNDLHPGVRIRLPESPPTTTERLGLARSVATSGQRRLRRVRTKRPVARDRLRQNSGCSPWGRCGLGLY
jgi:hypothetical protein